MLHQSADERGLALHEKGGSIRGERELIAAAIDQADAHQAVEQGRDAAWRGGASGSRLICSIVLMRLWSMASKTPKMQALHSASMGRAKSQVISMIRPGVMGLALDVDFDLEAGLEEARILVCFLAMAIV